MKIKIMMMMLFCLWIGLTGCSKEKSGTSSGVKEKMPAPEIKVISMDNQQLSLASLKGKVVLLNFWASWCPPCREEIPSMMKLNSIMAGKPFKMVCVSVDEGGKKAVEDYFRLSGYSLPTYLDPSGQAAKSFGITGVPETFVIDKNGVVAKRVIGGLDWSAPDVVAFIENLMK